MALVLNSPALPTSVALGSYRSTENQLHLTIVHLAREGRAAGVEVPSFAEAVIDVALDVPTACVAESIWLARSKEMEHASWEERMGDGVLRGGAGAILVEMEIARLHACIPGSKPQLLAPITMVRSLREL